MVSFKSRNTYLQNNCTCRSALDDRLGVYVNMEVLKRLSLQNIDVVSTATVGEEIGLKGASVIGSSMDFDAAIVVDVTHGVTPDGIKARSFYLDKGPVITKGPALNKKINRSIIDFCKTKRNPAANRGGTREYWNERMDAPFRQDGSSYCNAFDTPQIYAYCQRSG